MLGPEDVGHRVVVRRFVDPPPQDTGGAGGAGEGRRLMTDALGVLTSITGTELTINTDAGPLTIPRAAVVAAKRVPPPPPKRRPRRPPHPQT